MERLRQLSLFGSQPPCEPGDSDELPGFAHDLALARKVPDTIRFGTSSWTFPGWAGLVYRGRPSERTLVEKGLGEYATYPLFQSVGIDSSYYRPLPVETLTRYAEQLPLASPA